MNGIGRVIQPSVCSARGCRGPGGRLINRTVRRYWLGCQMGCMPVPRFGDAWSVGVISGSPSVTLTLPPTAESASQARHEITAAGLDDDIAHTVSLLVSEVVGNAIRHAAHAGVIHVAATLGPGYARV